MATGKIHFKSDAGGITSVSREAGATNGELVLPVSGTVVSVAAAVTDNAIARYDSTTGKLQNSGVTIDDAGNIGIGVTPSGWNSGKVLEIGYSGSSIQVGSSGSLNLGGNNYYNSGYKYANTGVGATIFSLNNGTYTWYVAPSGTAGNAITWTNAMTLDTSTYNNATTLTLDNPTNASRIDLKSQGTRRYSVSTDTSGALYFTNSAGNTAMTLNAGTNLYINSSYASGSHYFIVYGTNDFTYTGLFNASVSDSSQVYANVLSGTLKSAILANGTFQSATNVYGSTSDIKLKENVQDATPKLDKLMQVQVRNFNYIGQEDKQIGVIAQEIEQIFPSVVFETKDTKQVEVTKQRVIPAVEEVKDEEGNVITEAKPESIEEYTETETQETGEVTKNVKYSIIYMMMLKGLQELNAKVEAMQAEINELKGAQV